MDKEDISRPSLKRSAKVESDETVQNTPENSEASGDKNFLEVCIEETQTDVPDLGNGKSHEENSSNEEAVEKVWNKISIYLSKAVLKLSFGTLS